MASRRNGKPGRANRQRFGFGKREIRTQVERICASPEFLRSERLPRFLRYVVEETLAGRSADLAEYTVASEGLGKPDRFDPSQDPSVRVIAGRLRRTLERYYASDGRQDRIRIDLPTRTYVPTFEKQGTDSGNAGIAARRSISSSLRDKRPSIAVIPMLNLGDDSADSHIAYGLTYDLTIALARFQDLKVIPTLAPPEANGKQTDWRQFGADLNTRFILDGTLRREAGVARVANRLIDAKKGSILWCDEYRRALAPAVWIEIQEDIARRVVAQVASESGIIAQTLCREVQGKPPEHLDSYEAMLLFRHWNYRLTAEAFVPAFAALERAVSNDPQYACAWAALSNLHGTGYCFDVRNPSCSLEIARSYAEKAMELESCNQFVSLRWAYIHFLESQKEAFVEEAERGIALNPNNPHLAGLCGMLFTFFGLWDRGLQLLDESAKLNPHFPGQVHSGRFLYNLHLEEYEKAYDEAVNYGKPTVFWAWIIRACALGHLGRRAEAEEALGNLVKLKPDFPPRAREVIGRYVKVEELVDRMLEGLRKAGLQVTGKAG